MKQDVITAVDDRENDGYAEFSLAIRAHFGFNSGPLFTTNVEGLWDAFLQTCQLMDGSTITAIVAGTSSSATAGWCVSTRKASRRQRFGWQASRSSSRRP